MTKIITTLILTLFLMTGCSSFTKKQQETIVYDKTKEVYVLPDDEILKECDKLNRLKDGSFEELINFNVDTIVKYKQCFEKQKELKDWILRNHSNKK